MYQANSDTGIVRCKGPVVGTWLVHSRHSKEVVWLKQREERGVGDRCSCGQGLLCMESCGLW